jgi:serine/threonine protein kinase/DNA-binding beta-propeller fold protein YncE
MALTSGTKLGPYEILAPLGAGGMGEVYRARDSRLDRVVAIKVLPTSLAADTERLRRFEQEARSVAALNHPNILAVHDIGTHNGAPYMVCELLEGETLRERLQGGVLSSRKAVEYAIQVAQGLAAAYDKGIIHRDLKPENIFLTKDGRVKILDFGLAKIAPSRSAASNATQTLTSVDIALTEAGQVLGTAGYMSPEQVRGLVVDHRSDIFAFGSILFEMLSGKRAFSRDTAAETMAAILKEDPQELSEMNRNISPALDRIVRHCLEKNPDQRFQSARDLAFDLESLSQHSSSSAGMAAKPTAIQTVRRFQLPIMLFLVALGAAVGYLLGHKAKPSSEVTYHQLTFRKGTVLSARFAPDSRTIIYSAAWGGSPPELFSTRQDSVESKPMGVSQVDLLGVSSQGEVSVSLKPAPLQGFFGTQGTLGRTPLTGGTAPREMLENVEWSDWSPDGSNLLVVRTVDQKNRIEYPPGKVVYAVDVPNWISHPRISRDGKRIAFCVHPQRGDDRGSVTIINSDGSGQTKSFGNYASLYGLAWSPKDDEVWFTADPALTTIARRLMAVSLSGNFRQLAAAPGDLTLHDVSADGTAVIAIDDRERKIFFSGAAGAGSSSEEKELTWLDRAVLGALSSDGRQVVFHEGGKGGGSLGRIFLRKTDGSPAVSLGEGYSIALSPDQKWVLDSVPNTPPRMLMVPTGAGESIELKPTGVENILLQGFASDSRGVIFFANEPGHKARMFLFDHASSKLQPLTPEGTRGLVSSNGRFMIVRGDNGSLDLFSVGSGSPIHEIKGMQPQERPINISDDGKTIFVANPLGLSATVYRINVETGDRQLVRTLEMHDPTGSFGITRVMTTPDGQFFAFNTLRQLSELYLLQGLQ